MRILKESLAYLHSLSLPVKAALVTGICTVLAATVIVLVPPLANFFSGRVHEKLSPSGSPDAQVTAGDPLSPDVIDAAMLKISGSLELETPLFRSPIAKEHIESLIRRAGERGAALASSSDPDMNSGLRLLVEGLQELGGEDSTSAAAFLFTATQRLPETA